METGMDDVELDWIRRGFEKELASVREEVAVVRDRVIGVYGALMNVLVLVVVLEVVILWRAW
jgi:hypothetical protein